MNTRGIGKMIDKKNESFLPLVAYFLARLHKNRAQVRPSSLDTKDLTRLQILKDTAARLLKRHKRKSKVRWLEDFRE